jgi:ligand-binding sensor domain-containing protein
MRGILISAVLAFCLQADAWAAPHRLRVYNNPHTVLAITGGPDGFLWLATADGIYRFDGFHYHKITRFPFPSARFIAFTSDGSLWGGDFDGLAHLVKNSFEIALQEEINNLAAYPDQLFARLQKRMVRVGLDGSVRTLKPMPRRDLTIDSLGRLWFVCLDLKQVCWVDPNSADAIHAVGFAPDFQQYETAPDGKGRIWSADDEQAVMVERGRQVARLQRPRSHQPSRPGPLLPGRNGQLWFLGETVFGMTPPIEFRDGKDQDRFSPISGFEDRRGHLWVASANQGLTEWIPDPSWQRWFPEDFGGEAAALTVRDHRGAAIVATNANLYREDAPSGNWTRLTHEDHRYYSILPLDDGGFLASTRDAGLVRLAPDGSIVERLSAITNPPTEYRKLLRDAQGRLWAGAKRGFFLIEGQPGSLQLREQSLPDVQANDLAQAVDLDVDPAGRLWVGYAHGVAWLDDRGQWHKPVTDQPTDWLRSFTVTADDVWMAHRRAGVFTRMHRNGDSWTVTQFLAKAGYGPVDTIFLKRDSRGWIWRGASDGVHVCDGRHVAPNDWIHLNPRNGLIANETGQYGFTEDRDGSIWISGDEGVTHFRPDASWFDAPHSAPAPRITRVEADGRVYMFPESPPEAVPAAKVLRVDAGSLEASPFRDVPLRYRLLPLSREWRPMRDGSLEFRNLADDAYTLEIGYTGDGPSAVAAYSFRLGSAATGLAWGWIIGLAAAGGVMVPAVRHVPWLARVKFRIDKALFVMRRRYGRKKSYDPQRMASGAQDYAGEVLAGRYRLGRMVSRGGFSVVYEARDLQDAKARLAVKVLDRGRGQEGWVRDRFAHEVAALRSVEHPGVVRILDSWISPAGEPCLAMPFLDGETLRAALERGPLGLERGARITRQLAAALAEVHARGIIHRDLKPENMMLLDPATVQEQAVIIDFGTAGMQTAENELAATTMMSGSFHYMAPERLTGHYSVSSDVFSLGVIALEILTRKRLSDLQALFSDPSFHGELERALAVVVGEEQARNLADLLGPAYDPDPRRRPKDLKKWADEIAEALGA